MELEGKYLLKTIGWTVAMLVIAPALYAQSVQHGLVQEYHGSEPKTPLGNVSITASNASAVKSDDQGVFTLNFRTLHAGDAIQFRRVELNGYEVMNTEALEVARIADAKDPAQTDPHAALTIVMAPKETLRKLRDGYRSVAVQRYEKQLQASEAEIERLKKEGQLAEEQYNERMNALEEEYENRLAKLETYIDKFARIDLSDLDQDEQQIIELVQAGRFEEALQKYDSQNLSERLRQSREDQQKLITMRDQLDKAVRQKAADNQRLRQSIDRQVTLLCMAGGEDNFMKAHKILKETFLADTTDFEARRDYAFSLYSIGDYDEMIPLLKNGIAIEHDEYAKGMMLLELMDTQWVLEQYEEAFQLSQKIQEMLMPLAAHNFNVLTRALPAWGQIQLNYCLQGEDLTQGRVVADSLRASWSPDSLNVNSLSSYMDLLFCLNDFYSKVGDFEQTLWCASEIIRLGKRAYELNPSFVGLGEAYCTAANSYSYEGMIPEVRESARQCALYLDERVTKRGTKRVLEDATTIYYQLIDALILSKEFALADSIVQSPSAIKAVECTSGSDSELMRLYAGLCVLQKVRLMLEKGQVDQLEVLSEEALKMIEATEEGAGYGEMLRLEMNSRISLTRGRYKEATSQCKDFIRVNKETYKESPTTWNADGLCRSYLLMAEIYMAMDARGKANKMIKEAEKVAAFKINHQEIDKMKERIK